MDTIKGIEKLIKETQTITKIDISVILENTIISSLKDPKKVEVFLSNGKKIPHTIMHTEEEYTVLFHDDSKEAQTLLSLFLVSLNMYLSTNIQSMSIERFLRMSIDSSIDIEMIPFYQKKFKWKEEERVLLLIQSEENSSSILAIVEGILEGDQKAFVYDKDTVCILSPDASIAHAALNLINTELMTFADIGYSAPFLRIQDLPVAYAQAKEAIQIGSIFHTADTIYGYGQKKMTRLIYSMSKQQMEDFLHDYPSLECLGNEEIATINEFFRCNLNVAEAARNLYIHRNTLIYRIEKIKKETGLDIQNLEDALVLKMLMLINNAIRFK